MVKMKKRIKKKEKDPADLIYDFLKKNEGKTYSVRVLAERFDFSLAKTRSNLLVLVSRHMIFVNYDDTWNKARMYGYDAKHEKTWDGL